MTKSQQTTTQPQQWTTCVYVGTGHPYYRPAANNIQYTYFLRPSPVDIIILRCVGHRPLAELLLLQPASYFIPSVLPPMCTCHAIHSSTRALTLVRGKSCEATTRLPLRRITRRKDGRGGRLKLIWTRRCCCCCYRSCCSAPCVFIQNCGKNV